MNALQVLSVLSLLTVGAVACREAEPGGRMAGEPVTAPVASVELPPPVGEPPPAPAPPASEVPPSATVTTAAPQDPSAPSTSRDRCSPACTGDTICWIYEHRPPGSVPDGGGVMQSPFDDDADASPFRRELQCRPASATCPRGAHEQTARMELRNGVSMRWNTCVYLDGP